jgi:hypothetical protein
LALELRPAHSSPIIVFSQHARNDATAQCVVADFPKARFIHTVRDPITCFDSTYDHHVKLERVATGEGTPLSHYFKFALDVLTSHTNWDQPHMGMEGCTQAVRFEDLHLDTAATMCRVIGWLGLPYSACLVESTFDGVPWVVESGGVRWSGSRPEQTRRHFRNLFITDRILLYALFYEDFMAWGYPCPRVFACAWVRKLTWLTLSALPMKAELRSAVTVMRLQVFPGLRRGKVRFAIRCCLRVITCRWYMMQLIAAEFRRRLAGKHKVLQRLSDKDL